MIENLREIILNRIAEVIKRERITKKYMLMAKDLH